MSENLHDYRKSYEKGALSKAIVHQNPMEQFSIWFKEVNESDGFMEVNAMTISTVGLDGFPKGRVVLLKKYDDNGFYFYTNYNSEKGKSIEQNKHVSLSFFWQNFERQVIIKGMIEKTSKEDSEEYFHSRPKGSQLGAVVSHQSEVLESRKILETTLEKLEEKYKNEPVPMPEEWGGYLIKPISIEFWQGRPNRLHDRIRYRLEDEKWIIERLAP